MELAFATAVQSSAIPPFHFSTRILISLVASGLISTVCFATPTQEINAAVASDNSVTVQVIGPTTFLRGFGTVAMRIQPRDLPAYAGAAVTLRPDLSVNIVNAAISVAARKCMSNRAMLCALCDRIVKAAIAANPDSAVEIMRAAAAASPSLRDCILAAAIEAAPDLKLSFIQAVTADEILGASSFHTMSADTGFFGGTGSINPASMSGKHRHVNSPEHDHD